MTVVGRVGSFLSQGVYSVATLLHLFGGAVDIVVVKQQDGSFRSAPWYVRFGKFQGVLKGAKKIVRVSVNDGETGFHMDLDNSGEAYFVREIDSADETHSGVFQAVPGAPILASEQSADNLPRNTPQLHLVPGESTESSSQNVATTSANQDSISPRKQLVRTNVPTNDQIASLNLKEGQNVVTFSFSSRVLGKQRVDAHIYLWVWNAKIVISDVDGTITKSDVLGQFMPLVGRDWTQSGVARLFSAIKENGYQLLFLSARPIVQAYLTRSFLLNLKQDGKNLPNGPIVISPDGLFPSLYREVIRRAPHEFKIACLEDIRALFPADHHPFYAGFGNRDTDELSYRKIGIPKGKIFIINPKGEIAISHRIDVKSYPSIHTLVNDMFPPTSMVEPEEYNSLNYWKVPIPEIE